MSINEPDKESPQPRRWMILPKNEAYPNFNEVHREDDWCAKAGCVPVSDECVKAGKVVAAEESPSAPQPPLPAGVCLLCHWEPDYKKGMHLPLQFQEGTNIWVCLECVTCRRTVESFGLTIEELHKAADLFKHKDVASARVQALEEALPQIIKDLRTMYFRDVETELPLIIGRLESLLTPKPVNEAEKVKP